MKKRNWLEAVSASLLIRIFLTLYCFQSLSAQEGWNMLSGTPWVPGSPVISTGGISGIETHPGARAGAATAYYEGKIFVFGGATLPAKYPVGTGDYTNELWQYNTLYQVWQKLANYHFLRKGGTTCGPGGDYGLPSGPTYTNNPAPPPCEGALMAGFGNNLYVVGANNQMWRFNLLFKTWSDFTVSGTPIVPAHATAWIHNNKWYILGARAPSDPCTEERADLWAFDFATSDWSLVKSTGSCDGLPVYGTRGVPHASNHPGMRFRASATIHNGEAYLFGGNGNAIDGQGELNDLWIFNFSQNQWRWVGGSQYKNAPQVAGSKGGFSGMHQPSGRHGSALFANQGKVFMQGGLAANSNNCLDLWAFDTLSKQWSWTNGDTSTNLAGVFGSRNQASANFYPGSKHGMGYWTQNNNFYVWGGYGLDSNGRQTITSDIWKYDPSDGKWAWKWGDASHQFRSHYGTPGVWSASNFPGARKHAVAWQWMRRFFLFGGNGYDRKGKLGWLNDLWEFDPIIRQWRWLGGSDTCNAETKLGANAYPGGREQSLQWVHQGKIWMMGGYGKGSNGAEGALSDLWQYDPQANLWQYKGGPMTANDNGHPGDSTIFAPANWPLARVKAARWVNNGSLYLYGGQQGREIWGSSGRSDLWEFNTGTEQWRWLAGEQEWGVDHSDGSTHPRNYPSPGSGAIGNGFWYRNKEMAVALRRQMFYNWSWVPDSLKWRYLDVSANHANFGGYNYQMLNYGAIQAGNDLLHIGGYGINYRFMGCLDGVYVESYVDEMSVRPSNNFFAREGVYSDNMLDPPIIFNNNSNTSAQRPGGRADMVAWWLPGQFYIFGGIGIDVSQRLGLQSNTWLYRFKSQVVPIGHTDHFWVPDVHQMPDISTTSEMVATVWPSGSNAAKGGLEVGVLVKPQALPMGYKWLVGRGFDFQFADNSTSATSHITLYCTQSDFDLFNEAAGATLLPGSPSDAVGKSRLRVSQFQGQSADSSGLPDSYPGPETLIDPADTDIVWNSEHNRWEISFNATGSGGFFIHSYDVLLPVRLFSLEARQREEQVDLNWQLESSTPVGAFEVEWSANGQQWRKLHTQNLGSPVMRGAFAYTDALDASRQQVAVLHYRILALQQDGGRTLSPVRQVKLVWMTGVKLLSNPVREVAMLEFKTHRPQEVQIALLDITGRVVSQERLMLPSGVTRRSLPVSHLAAGQYQVVTTINGKPLAPIKLQKR